MLGSSCIAPDPAMAQNSVRKRRIGVLINLESTDPESRDRVSALTDGLKAAGWDMDRELEIEYRWTGGSPDLIRNAVRQLVEMKPDVILVAGYTATNQIRALDPSVQIVFTNVSNPVASGLIQNIASPGGNLTGFMTQLDWSIGAKWVDLLVEAKPTINRIAVLYDPTLSTGMGQRAAIEYLDRAARCGGTFISDHIPSCR